MLGSYRARPFRLVAVIVTLFIRPLHRRRLSLLVHPDKNGDHPLAADAFAAAQGAFRALERRQA